MSSFLLPLLLADAAAAEAAADVPTESVAETVSGPWTKLVENFVQLAAALWGLLLSLGEIALPWLPLLAWVAVWTFAVNWVRLRRIVVFEGGWIGIVLLGFVAVIVWGTVAPPQEGYHNLLGMTVGNYVGKTIYVTALIVIAFLCGSVQLSGAAGVVERFEEEDEALREAEAHAGH